MKGVGRWHAANSSGGRLGDVLKASLCKHGAAGGRRCGNTQRTEPSRFRAVVTAPPPTG